MKRKTVLITGGSGNLGMNLIGYYLEKNWNVIFTSRKKDNIDQINKYFSEKKGECLLLGFKLDISSEKNITDFVNRIVKEEIKFEALINNAAVDSTSNIKDLEYYDVFNLIQINFIGTVWLTKAVSEYWVSHNIRGSIVNISSLLSINGCDRSSIYAASKAAMESFSRCFSIEYGDKDIRINTVRIAGMNGDLNGLKQKSRVVLPSENLENNKNDFNKTPLKRGGQFKEFINMVFFLSEEKSSYITGQTFNVDGGVSILYPAYSLPDK